MENRKHSNESQSEVLYSAHSKYLKRCLQLLPPSLASLDVSRLTIAFFAISGLDLLNCLHLIEDQKYEIIEWIYSLQILPQNIADNGCGHHGFRGSTANGCNNSYDCGNLAMTYCALSSLLILGDDLKRVNKSAIINGLKDHQLEDGRYALMATLVDFIPVVYEKENDMRFVYCATTVCYILQDWSAINIEKTIQFIKNSLSFESGFGQKPGLESHGGSTYCALAALTLMDQLHNVLNRKQMASLKRWCLFKQCDGFQGRPNKDTDTCYSFWVGGALKLLNAYNLVNVESNERFIKETQDIITGGFAKYPDSTPDPMHTYLGLSGLALNSKNNRLLSVNPALNISERAVSHLKQLHTQWLSR